MNTPSPAPSPAPTLAELRAAAYAAARVREAVNRAVDRLCSFAFPLDVADPTALAILSAASKAAEVEIARYLTAYGAEEFRIANLPPCPAPDPEPAPKAAKARRPRKAGPLSPSLPEVP